MTLATMLDLAFVTLTTCTATTGVLIFEASRIGHGTLKHAASTSTAITAVALLCVIVLGIAKVTA